MHQDMESDGERNTLSSCIDKNTCKRYYTHWSRGSVVGVLEAATTYEIEQMILQ
jgi:hypothetical protein